MLTVLNCLLLASALPLFAFVVLLLAGHRIGRRGSGAPPLGLTFALGSLAFSVVALILWVQNAGGVEAFTYRWIALPSSHAQAPAPVSNPSDPLTPPAPGDALTGGTLVDSLTITMFMSLTILNVLIHLFAWGQRTGQDSDARSKPAQLAWLAFLNFALLGLVLANSLVQLLVFWEFTSLACFFLIRMGTADGRAALRMYVMQALGSAAFILAIGILVAHTASLSSLSFFDAQGNPILSQSISQTLGVATSEFLYFSGGENGGGGFLQMHWLTWAGICFLVAALARMALFPFQTWLSHLAEVPAAVSAMIAAGTLAGGVILLARVYPILTLDTRLIAAVVGCVTLAAGAAIALVQTDIRKILLWSTVSQGGYVLLFLGSGGYVAGVMHLFTHGFVKTALLLATGSVVASTGTADIRQMGGLWKRMPLTAVGSLLAVAALGEVPWLSGAYSTNLGLCCVYDYAQGLQQASGRHFEFLLFHVPAIFTYVTALGVGRWWWLIFGGVSRDAKRLEATHESAFLTLPIIMLAGTYAGVLYDFGKILLPLIYKSIPAVLFPHGAPALVISGSTSASDRVLLDTGWAFTGLLVAGLLHYKGFTLSSKFRRLPGVNVVDFWLRGEMFFDELYEGVLAPLAGGVVGLAGLLERVGRMLVRVVSNIGPLGNALAARIERAKMAPPSAQASPPPKGNP